MIFMRRKLFPSLLFGILLALMMPSDVIAQGAKITITDHKKLRSYENKKIGIFDPVAWKITDPDIVYDGGVRIEMSLYKPDGVVYPSDVPKAISETIYITDNLPKTVTASFPINTIAHVEDADAVKYFYIYEVKIDNNTGNLLVAIKPSYEDDGYADPDDDSDSEEEDTGKAEHNPDAIGAYYYINSVLQSGAAIGKQEQPPVAQALFAAAVPAGWKSAFSMSMSLNGLNEYSRKTGTIVLYVPEAYQKSGRQYAILAMEKGGRVVFLPDNDLLQNTVTVTPDIEGYAYVLIYKD